MKISIYVPTLPALDAIPEIEKPVIGIVRLFRQPNTDAEGGKYPKLTGALCILGTLECCLGRRPRRGFVTCWRWRTVRNFADAGIERDIMAHADRCEVPYPALSAERWCSGVPAPMPPEVLKGIYVMGHQATRRGGFRSSEPPTIQPALPVIKVTQLLRQAKNNAVKAL